MIDILVPIEQEGTKAVVRAWLRQPGEVVALHDPLVELETDKVTQEVPAPAAGVLDEIVLAADAEAKPGAVLGRLRPAAPAGVPERIEDAEPSPQGPNVERSGAAFLSPSVRRLVEEHRVDPASLAGSGRGGRLTRADVERAVAARQDAQAQTQAPSREGNVRHVAHDRMRLTIAENMLRSVIAAPHVTAVFEADLGAVLTHQRAHRETAERQGTKLTLSAYMVAAAAAAMRAQPAINSRWFDDRLEIHEDINIGVGTALGERGLIVPVLHRAQDLSLFGIAARLTDLTARARAGTLKPADLRGGTFTISNHGVSGSLLAAPVILHQSQSAILGVGRVEKRVVVREVNGSDAMLIRPMCYVSLTIDHRAVDGHQTNAWLTRFVEKLESWPA